MKVDEMEFNPLSFSFMTDKSLPEGILSFAFLFFSYSNLIFNRIIDFYIFNISIYI